MGRTENPELPDRLQPALHSACPPSSTPVARGLGLPLCTSPVGLDTRMPAAEGGPLTQGTVCSNRRQALHSLQSLLTGPSVITESTAWLLLDNRSWGPGRWERDLTKTELKPELRLLSHRWWSFLFYHGVCRCLDFFGKQWCHVNNSC